VIRARKRVAVPNGIEHAAARALATTLDAGLALGLASSASRLLPLASPLASSLPVLPPPRPCDAEDSGTPGEREGGAQLHVRPLKGTASQERECSSMALFVKPH
jgi:hypothetical protein